MVEGAECVRPRVARRVDRSVPGLRRRERVCCNVKSSADPAAESGVSITILHTVDKGDIGCGMAGHPLDLRAVQKDASSDLWTPLVCDKRGCAGREMCGVLNLAPNSQSKPPLEPQEDLQTWGHQLHHSVLFGDSSRTQKQSGPAPLDDSQDLQTVGNQPPH
ncbi:unnamed protein product [Boreogadus saida]